MEVSGSGKSPNSSMSFRYNASNEELEELYHMCDDDPPPPLCEPPITTQGENASPKRMDKSSSILDKYFKSMRPEKSPDKVDEVKGEPKPAEEVKPLVPPKDLTASPMKEYLNRLGKRNTTSEGSIDIKEGSNETWKLFHDIKFKIVQAVDDIKTRSADEPKEKSVVRDNSMSDSEENPAVKDSDQQSVGDTDNQVSSLDSSMQNLSEMTQAITAKPFDRESSLPLEKNNSESSDDTHKNLANSESGDVAGDLLDDSMMEVESGIEAFEDNNIDINDINYISKDVPDDIASGLPFRRPPLRSMTPTNFGTPPSKHSLNEVDAAITKHYFLNYSMYIFTFLVVVNYLLFPNSHIWNGFLLGLWVFCFSSNFKQWFLDNYFSSEREPQSSFFQLKRSSAMPSTYTIPVVKEHKPIKKYEGWVNHHRFPEYDPVTYHINKTTTAYMKLEGCNLRISYTGTKIAKRALWDEKIENIEFYQHRLYNLSGARVILLPKGLVKKRQWSKKYPICVILNEREKIQVLEKENAPLVEPRPGETYAEGKKKESQQESESTETSVSPEKKKKFVWRRREKSISHSEPVEPGKEGLRHRIVRKMHRDKKTDSVSTGTEPESQEQDAEERARNSNASAKEDDDDLDDNEMYKLKELLEEAERGSNVEGAEGEWSVHFRNSKDSHSHLYIFGRTGRDKHEWFRRINAAVYEASQGSTESSLAEDRSASDIAPESKEGVESQVFKVSERDSVAFSKSTKSNASEPSIIFSPLSSANLPNLDYYEKTFWPYLIKIMQTHETNYKLTAEAGVMCEIEPTPRDRSKSKKKRKSEPKPAAFTCECRVLPAEVTWLNTVLARVLFDFMKDPAMNLRVQKKIQGKLNTLKLPAFMSPLVVTELSLAGACPLVERVAVPSWDERGVWLDADMRYDGGASLTILTQINLMKLKEKNLTLEDQILTHQDHVVENDTNSSYYSGALSSEKQLRKRKPAIFDSDVEDSAESSEDDESPQVQPVDSIESLPPTESMMAVPPDAAGSSKNKFLRMLDKISTNKYFQQVTDFKYVKRAMEGLSNTDIKLQVEVQGLEGRLAVNLPPPPHDRVWFGFRTNPQLVLKARPAVGARTLRFAHISNWIELKLSKEFEKILVLPNMEDIALDFMTPTPVSFD